jgi:hypothetical protein
MNFATAVQKYLLKKPSEQGDKHELAFPTISKPQRQRQQSA